MTTSARIPVDRSLDTISIAGLGPKGLQCLERLLAELAKRRNRPEVCIHVFDGGGHAGTSRVYHPDLPEYLPINNARAEEITSSAATHDLPSVASIPLFAEWIRGNGLPLGTAISRSSVGKYLKECFAAVVAAAPPGVVVRIHQAEVIDVDPDPPALQIRGRRMDGSEFALKSGHLLLATGHGIVQSPAASPCHRGRGAVGLRGLGLAAIDLILGFTEGRGGRFEVGRNNRLAYRRSGDEPQRIVPFCRTGVPILPAYQRREDGDRPLSYFTAQRLAELTAGGKRRLGWNDLWGLAEREFQHQYESAFDHFASLGKHTQRGRSIPPFQISRIFTPSPLAAACSDDEYAVRVQECMRALLSPLEFDVEMHAYRHAVSAWYEMSEVLGPLSKHNLIQADSHVHLVRRVMPIMRRTAFGAVAGSIRKLLALAEAGLLDLSMLRSRDAEEHPDGHGWGLRSTHGRHARLDSVVDAFVPGFDFETCDAELFAALRRRGAVRAHIVPDAVHTNGRTGAVDVTPDEQLAITRCGKIDERIAIVGSPTEGKLLNTWTICPGDFPGEWAKRICNLACAGRAENSTSEQRRLAEYE